MIAQVGHLALRFIDGGIEGDDAPQEVSAKRAGLRLRRTDQLQGVSELSGDVGCDRSKPGSETAPRAAEIRPGQDHPGADDADPDLAGAGHGQHEDLPAIRTPHRAELVAGDDGRGVAGERRRIGGEIAQQRGDKPASSAPERQAEEEADPLLWKRGGQRDDHDRPDDGADQAEPALAQGGAEAWLTDDGGGGGGPIGVVELEPKGDVEGEADGGPEAQAEEQRWGGQAQGTPQPARSEAQLEPAWRPKSLSAHMPSFPPDMTPSAVARTTGGLAPARPPSKATRAGRSAPLYAGRPASHLVSTASYLGLRGAVCFQICTAPAGSKGAHRSLTPASPAACRSANP